MKRTILLVSLLVLLPVLAIAEPAAAKPLCVTGSDCGRTGDGTLCTRYDRQGGYWTDCAVDWGGCGILYHRCIRP